MAHVYASSSLSLVALLFLAGGCETNDRMLGTIEGTFGRSVHVNKRETALFLAYEEGHSDQIAISISEIYDSRCPEDVICIWGGYASVTFEIRDLENNVTLCIGWQSSSCPDTFRFSMSGISYRLVLIDVLPYPNTKRPRVQQTVEFILHQDDGTGQVSS